MQDKLEKERNDAKNAVEEYVYDFRDKLGTVYEKFITQEVSLNYIIFYQNYLFDSVNTNYVNKHTKCVTVVNPLEPHLGMILSYVS